MEPLQAMQDLGMIQPGLVSFKMQSILDSLKTQIKKKEHILMKKSIGMHLPKQETIQTSLKFQAATLPS